MGIHASPLIVSIRNAELCVDLSVARAEQGHPPFPPRAAQQDIYMNLTHL